MTWRFLTIMALVTMAMVKLASSSEQPAVELLESGLVAHEAIYEIELMRAGGGISAASGLMTLRFADACDGWTVETRNELALTDSQGESVRSTWEFLGWESKDGLHYRFNVTASRGEKDSETIRGEAHLESIDYSGEAIFTQPEEKILSLPPGTLFPTNHTFLLLHEAIKGTLIIRRPVFDGTELVGALDVNAVIGPPLAAEPVEEGREQGNLLLTDHPSWRMRLAYFYPETPDDLPVHEIGVRYYNNGIGQEIVQDYTDFRVRLNLKSLHLLPKPDC